MENEAKTKRNLRFPIAVLVITLITFATIFLFLNSLVAFSPLGKLIDVSVFCDETGEAIEGLGIWVWSETANYREYRVTDGKGNSGLFGTGMPDGKYWIGYYWNAPYEFEVEINCSQIVWHFDVFVPNPVIIKHFAYDLPTFDNPPIVGLNVTLMEDGIDKTWALTNATGTVTFGGQYVAVCHDYQLKYTWGGVQYTTPQTPIHFYIIEGELPICLWEEWNYLEPKRVGVNSA